MNESEALKLLKKANRDNDMVGILPKSDIGKCLIKALEEVQQYREIGTVEELKQAKKYVRLSKNHGTIGQVIDVCAEYEEIGTVEECRTSVEKMKPKNVIKKYKPVEPEDIEAFGKDSYFGHCPECKSLQNTVWNQEYCGDCGQRLDWRGEK